MAIKQDEKRVRLSVDLDAHPDVRRMLERVEKDMPGVPRSVHVIKALRKNLTGMGYARKKGRQRIQ